MANFSKIVFIVFFVMSPLFATTNAKQALLDAALSFDKGQYKRALSLLEGVDIRSDFDDSDDMKLAFKIRAVSYEQTGETTRASETIRELFYLDPDYKFDAFDTPKSVVTLAQKEKNLLDEKNKELASIMNEAKNDPKRAAIDAKKKTAFEKTIVIEKKPHVITTLFPFGLNHFFLGSPLKGGIYCSLQALSLTTNIAAFWWKQSYLGSYGGRHLREPHYGARFDTAQLIQFIALSAMVVSYGASIIDALIRFQSIPTQKISSSEITS